MDALASSARTYLFKKYCVFNEHFTTFNRTSTDNSSNQINVSTLAVTKLSFYTMTRFVPCNLVVPTGVEPVSPP